MPETPVSRAVYNVLKSSGQCVMLRHDAGHLQRSKRRQSASRRSSVGAGLPPATPVVPRSGAGAAESEGHVSHTPFSQVSSRDAATPMTTESPSVATPGTVGRVLSSVEQGSGISRSTWMKTVFSGVVTMLLGCF